MVNIHKTRFQQQGNSIYNIDLKTGRRVANLELGCRRDVVGDRRPTIIFIFQNTTATWGNYILFFGKLQATWGL